MEELKTVLRIEKIKTYTELKNKNSHIYRLKHPENADKSRTHLNKIVYGKGDAHIVAENKIKNLGYTVRKDAVLALDIVLSLSSEAFKTNDDIKNFVKAGAEWYLKNFEKENIMSIVLHLDEETPHMHCHFIPINEGGKLSAKSYMKRGYTDKKTGEKIEGDLEKMQFSYNEIMKEKVNEKLTYTKGSKANRKTLNEFYSELNKTKEKFENENNVLKSKAVAAEKLSIELKEKVKDAEQQIKIKDKVNENLRTDINKLNNKVVDQKNQITKLKAYTEYLLAGFNKLMSAYNKLSKSDKKKVVNPSASSYEAAREDLKLSILTEEKIPSKKQSQKFKRR